MAIQVLPDGSILVNKAIVLAVEHHKNQVRKGDGLPYITHPVAVALLLAGAGYGAPVIAAGLCHDLLEDTTCTPAELRNELGADVLSLVQDVSEPDKRLSWEERKQAHLEHVRHAPREAQAIAIADKLHNVQSMYEGYQARGMTFFAPFKRDVQTSIGQAEKLYAAVAERYPDCPLLPDLRTWLDLLKEAVNGR